VLEIVGLARTPDRAEPQVLYQGGGIGGYDLISPADRIFSFDYNSSGRLDHLALYRPGETYFWILRNSFGRFASVYQGSGIGGYDLVSPADRAFAFDYDHSGKQDHLALYRPGETYFWILRNNGGNFASVYQGSGIGGYDLVSPADRAFAFDNDSSGKLDHIALYRPGETYFWILRNSGGNFTSVYQGSGIGGYDLVSPADRALAFDYNSSGKLDHLLLYRPGETYCWILRNNGGNFAPVYQGSGIGGFNLASPNDRIFAFDYNNVGKLDHLVLYRPGTGTIWILRNNGGSFAPVYAMGDPGSGIRGYNLQDLRDRALAFDFNGNGRQDNLVLYRPGTGLIWILNSLN
jgi:hypothetical protein